jgi:pilus assembly protein Flp/PilA
MFEGVILSVALCFFMGTASLAICTRHTQNLNLNGSFTLQAQARPMTRISRRFAGDESGATSIEYALIAVLVAVAIIGSVTALGDSLQSIFYTVSTEVGAALQN